MASERAMLQMLQAKKYEAQVQGYVDMWLSRRLLSLCTIDNEVMLLIRSSDYTDPCILPDSCNHKLVSMTLWVLVLMSQTHEWVDSDHLQQSSMVAGA